MPVFSTFSMGQRALTTDTTNTGSITFVVPGTYTWEVPAEVTSISVVCVGGGGAGGRSTTNYTGGGGAGALVYANNIPTTPGDLCTIQVGRRGLSSEVVGGVTTSTSGSASTFKIGTFVLSANGGTRGEQVSPTLGPYLTAAGGKFLILNTFANIITGGGFGGNGGAATSIGGGGGAGAGGYNGPGGNGRGNGSNVPFQVFLSGIGFGSGGGGGSTMTAGTSLISADGFPGNGGGAGGRAGQSQPETNFGEGGGGGGGANIYNTGYNPNGGDGRYVSGNSFGGDGGFPGGGGGGSNGGRSGSGGNGAVRIIWGESRQFPDNALDDYNNLYN